jgi:hypothetical protein
LGLKKFKEICLQDISFSLDPDPDSDADPNQDLIKMLLRDLYQSGSTKLSDQIGSRSETMLSTIQIDHGPVLCGIVQDNGPALYGIVQELFDEMLRVDPALCGIARDQSSAMQHSAGS